MKKLGVSLGMVALTACAALPSLLGNTLEGSIASSEDLTFDEVQARRFSTGEVEIRYLRNQGGNNEVVTKVVVKTPSEGISYGQDIDLVANQGSVSRVVQDAEDFPPLKTGSIRFDTGAVNKDERTTGRFNATFDNDKTLRGSFDASLTLVE